MTSALHMERLHSIANNSSYIIGWYMYHINLQRKPCVLVLWSITINKQWFAWYTQKNKLSCGLLGITTKRQPQSI